MKKLLLIFPVVILLITSSLIAKSDLGIKAVGGRIGYIMPGDDIESTIGFGGHIDLGSLMPELTLHTYLDYWSKSEDFSDFNNSFSLMSLTAIVKYHFPMSGDIKPYAGGGLGLNIGSAKWESYDAYFERKIKGSESETKIALNLIGGAAMEFSPIVDGFVEVRYLTGDFDYFGLFFGISYKLE